MLTNTNASPCERTRNILEEVRCELDEKDNLLYDMASVIRDYGQIMQQIENGEETYSLFTEQTKRKAQEALERMGSDYNNG